MLLLVTAADFAEEPLDLLLDLEEHSLSQQDVDPGVQDGVDRGKADGLQIRVLLQPYLHLWLVQLVDKYLHLTRKNPGNMFVLHKLIK